ncbi:hypothetical protein [Fusobacterium hwasookii]|uniref:hypothetical protein n=1 Tax=Fusobacterium hwasookii TaxID=1583098 RepID=UPI0004BB58D6|nr:hypothetical protein [Fusobacterium hwasookii]QNE66306.1 hypothetical protein H5V36_10845 [Fusobacterium hwasookii]
MLKSTTKIGYFKDKVYSFLFYTLDIQEIKRNCKKFFLIHKIDKKCSSLIHNYSL